MENDFLIISDEEIKKFNEKIKRYKRKESSETKMYLPQEISRKYIEELEPKEQIRLKADIIDFLKKDSMNVDKLSGERKWLKKIYSRRFEELEKKKKELREKLNVSTEKGTMGSTTKLNLNPSKNKFDNMTHGQILKSLKGIERALAKDAPNVYKESYMKAVETMFGKNTYGYNIVKNIIDQIDAETLFLLYGEDADLQLDFYYTEGESLANKLETVLNAFYDYGFTVKDEAGTIEFEEIKQEIHEEYD